MREWISIFHGPTNPKTSVPIPRPSVDWEWDYTHYIYNSHPSFGHAQFRGGDHGIHVLAANLGSECRLLAVGDKPIHNLTRPTEQRYNLMRSLYSQVKTEKELHDHSFLTGYCNAWCTKVYGVYLLDKVHKLISGPKYYVVQLTYNGSFRG